MRKHHCADIAPFHYNATRSAHLLLQAHHPGANSWEDAHARGGVGDRLIADQAGHVFVIEQNAIFFFAGFETDLRFGCQLRSDALSSSATEARRALRAKARYMAPVSRFSRPKCRARWRAIVLLPAPAGPSIATMIFRIGLAAGDEAFCRAHPRFFVPLFERAVNPNRLLLPALAPAVSAGLRPLRDVPRASTRTSLRAMVPLRLVLAGLAVAWPFRLVQDGAAEAPFLFAAPFPLVRPALPFECAGAAWFPLLLPLEGALQRVPFAGRAALVELRVPLDGRAPLALRPPFKGRAPFAVLAPFELRDAEGRASVGRLPVRNPLAGWLVRAAGLRFRLCRRSAEDWPRGGLLCLYWLWFYSCRRAGYRQQGLGCRRRRNRRWRLNIGRSMGDAGFAVRIFMVKAVAENKSRPNELEKPSCGGANSGNVPAT